MASPKGDFTYSNLNTGGNARVHAGNSYNTHTYNYTLRQRRSDETLRGSEKHRVFVQAVVEGQLPRVRNFLRMGVDIDETGSSDLTVLHRAVLSGHEDVIEPLIEAGADVNAMSEDFGTPLCLAALKGMDGAVDILLKYRAKTSALTQKMGTALHCCVLSVGDHRATLMALLAAGARVATQATVDTRWLHVICAWDGDERNQIGSPEQVEGCILCNTTPAFLAVQFYQSRLLQLLLPPDLDHAFCLEFWEARNAAQPPPSVFPVRKLQVNKKNVVTRIPFWNTYLSSCAKNGDHDGVRFLIAKGAELNPKDGNVYLPLIAASVNGDRHIAVLLLDSGASIEGTLITGSTALHCAARSGSYSIAQLLCERGAMVDRKDIFGDTALHFAAENGYHDIVRLLCECSAETNVKNSSNSTPLHYAVIYGHHETIAMLCQFGAAVDAEDDCGRTPLWQAASNQAKQEDSSCCDEKWHSFQTLIDAGADINTTRARSGTTPLLAMLQNGNDIDTSILEQLIKAGADTRCRANDGTSVILLCLNKPLSAIGNTVFKVICLASGYDGATVDRVHVNLTRLCRMESVNKLRREQLLIYDAACCGIEDLRLILSLGADIGVADSAIGTSMHWAARNGNCNAIDRLLAYGAPLDCSDDKWRTPLTVAVLKKHTQAVQRLLHHGANPRTKGPGRHTRNAIETATRMENDQILSLLQRRS